MIEQDWVLSNTDQRGVTTITLNRADKHNAFNDTMIDRLTQSIKQAIQSPQTRLIVIRANGNNFSAGADLNWMQSMAKYSEDENIDDATDLGKLMHILYHSPKPTICLAQGKTFGGGIGLIACCHIAIAEEGASFCFSEAKLGIIPAVISPFIVNAIGPRWTRYYFLTASPFDAKHAYQMGLCHQLTDKDNLDFCLERTLKALLNNGPNALRTINKLVDDLTPLSLDDALLQSTAKLIAKVRVSEEGQMGINAFLTKKRPQWLIDEKS